MRELMVKSLDLQSNTHANTLWPWDTLHLRECNVTMLALLPNPVGSVRDVGCPQLFMDARVTQVGAKYIVHELKGPRYSMGHSLPPSLTNEDSLCKKVSMAPVVSLIS